MNADNQIAAIKSLITECVVEALAKVPIHTVAQSEPLEVSSGPKYMNVPETANYLRMSEGSIRARARENKIPYIREGKKFLFLKKDLDNFMKSTRFKSEDEIRSEIYGSHKKG